MKKSTIYIVIALMAFALVGLTAVQVFWINNSIKLKEAQFRYNVNSAICEIPYQLELAERKKEIQEDNAARALLKQRLEQVADPSSVNDKVLNKITNEFHDQKTRYMAELYENFFGINTRTLHQKIDLDDIKSVVDAVLLSRGIDAENNLAILSDFGQTVAIQDNLEAAELISLQRTRYVVNIFDKDFFSNGYRLHIDFPNERKHLLLSLWPVLLTSSILMLILIGAFTFTITTIFRQKKLSLIKNDFIGNMTHELKTPISTISLACEALTDPGMSANKSANDRYVRMIKEENSRLGTLVENVLRTAILDKGELKLEPEKLGLKQVLSKVCNSVEIRITKNDGKLIQEYPNQDIYVLGDPTHLENVFYNLLDNAIKYSPNNPKIQVKISQQNSDYVQVEIIDNGIGISKENLNKIFDKLYRVPSGNLHDVKGFGLGLSYLKVIIEKHNGSVSAKSKIGEGSKFTIKLPTYNGQ